MCCESVHGGSVYWHGRWSLTLYAAHLDVLVQPVLEEKEPCYIFYRLDTYNVQSNYLWVFMSYTPDFAPVSETGPPASGVHVALWCMSSMRSVPCFCCVVYLGEVEDVVCCNKSYCQEGV